MTKKKKINVQLIVVIDIARQVSTQSLIELVMSRAEVVRRESE